MDYRRYKEIMNVISCVLLTIQGRNEYDQLCITGDTGEESTVGYRRNMERMNVISCVLAAIPGRNECDQLWFTGDTGEK